MEVAMSKKCTPLWREAHFEVTRTSCKLRGARQSAVQPSRFEAGPLLQCYRGLAKSFDVRMGLCKVKELSKFAPARIVLLESSIMMPCCGGCILKEAKFSLLTKGMSNSKQPSKALNRSRKNRIRAATVNGLCKCAEILKGSSQKF